MSQLRKRPSVDERRMDGRWPLVLRGVVAVPCEDLELNCTVVDLSSGGAGVTYAARTPRHELVGQLRIPCIGVFDGITTRSGSLQCGFRFLAGEAERIGLTSKLAALVSQGFGENKRVVATRTKSSTLSLTLPEGNSEECRVLNISLQAVYLLTNSRPSVGQLLRVGSFDGKVTQRTPQGIILTFVPPSERDAPKESKMTAKVVNQQKILTSAGKLGRIGI